MSPLLNQGKMSQLTEIPKSTTACVGSGLPREKQMCLTEERGSAYSSSLVHKEQLSSTGLYSSIILILRQGFAKFSRVALHSEDIAGLGPPALGYQGAGFPNLNTRSISDIKK